MALSDSPHSLKSRLWSLIQDSRLGLVLTSLLIVYLTRSFWMAPIPGGWDTMPQINLFFEMADLLKQGTVFGYDLSWFGGYPVFVFYGFLPYFLAGAVHLLSLGLLPVLFLSKLVFVGSLVFFLLSFYWCARTFFGKNAGWPAVLCSFVFLLYPLHAGAGIGLNGVVAHGVFNTVFGLALILANFTSLERFYQTSQRRYFVVAVLLSAAIVFTHAISSVAALIILTGLFFGHRDFKGCLVYGLWVIAITAFYTYPYIVYGEFSDPHKLSAMNMGNSALENLIAVRFEFIVDGHGLSFYFPYFNLGVFGIFLVGYVQSIKERKLLLPSLLLVHLFVICEDYFFTYTEIPLHYYRFHAFFMAIYLLISVQGFMLVFGTRPWKLRHKAGAAALACLLVHSLYVFRFEGEPIEWNGARKSEKDLLTYFESAPVTGRVLVERDTEEQEPHLFSSLLPLKENISVPNGLLKESADNSRYIFPVLKEMTTALVWGNIRELPYKDYSLLVPKIRDGGVEYLVLESTTNATRFSAFIERQKSPEFRLETTIGKYLVFKTATHLPLISPLRHAPILYMKFAGGLPARTLIDALYDSRLDPAIKIAFVNANDVLADSDALDRFGLIILGGDDAAELRRIVRGAKRKKIVLVSDDEGVDDMKQDAARGGNSIRIFRTGELSELLSYLAKEVRLAPPGAAVTGDVTDLKIRFTSSGPTVLNMGYFPHWKHNGKPVYRLSPSKILVFGEGENVLQFKLPWIQKLLMGLSLLAILTLLFGPRVRARFRSRRSPL